MAKWTYDESLRRLLADEGGYSNHPADPGGPTNFGITIADYRNYVKPDATAADVRAMKLAEAKRIYREKYWDAMRCDALPTGVDYCVFDYGVNSGIGRSGKVLRALVGLPTNTSAITDEVIAAVAKRDPKVLVAAICDERLAFLQGLKTWPTFGGGGGWGRRVKGVKAAATVMAGKSEPSALPPEIVPAGSAGKGVVPPPTAAKHAITKGAPAVTVAAGAGLWDWVWAHQIASAFIIASIIFGIVMAVRALKAWHTAKQETPPADLQPVPEITPPVAA